MTITKEDIASFEQRYRAAFVNSLSGFKSANLIGSRDGRGAPNLAIFSSVVHLGSDPALMGFVMRPVEPLRHTYRNIKESGAFTINAIPFALRVQAHATSARYEDGVSEFEACGFSQEYIGSFLAPFVKESPIKLACTLADDLLIPANGTRFITARVEAVHLSDDLLRSDGYVDIAKAGIAALSSLDGYHTTGDAVRYAYAKPGIPVRELIYGTE